ncbi:hypothetical protein B9G98_01578 [Wickerhamiella sorbophila]|uniref:Uncharacterized protein n=1 Tax=Wickerhamiella sorbophila TaxID=45607 RepID=A0A2T0FG42_9ASCO|nr:hypothetical protein B9G98_01578 [Wickerhamiella sorbophila]PRT53958.1 hypothetical protein B9G98_01578 [Wickerhamiella sorbophila]
MAKKKKVAKVEGEVARELVYDALVRALPDLSVGGLLRDEKPEGPRSFERPATTADQINVFIAQDEKRILDIMADLKTELGNETYNMLIGGQERSFIDMQSIAAKKPGKTWLEYIKEENEQIGRQKYTRAPLAANEMDLLKEIDMDKLYSLLTPQEQQVLEQSGAFHSTKLPAETYIDRFMIPYTRYEEAIYPPVADVEVHSRACTDLIVGQHAADELQYIETALRPQEARNLAAELYYALRAGRPITHLGFSDLVSDAIGPSNLNRYLLSADASFKYSTAQYIKVYEALREAKLQYEVDLLCARFEGIYAATDANSRVRKHLPQEILDTMDQSNVFGSI